MNVPEIYGIYSILYSLKPMDVIYVTNQNGNLRYPFHNTRVVSMTFHCIPIQHVSTVWSYSPAFGELIFSLNRHVLTRQWGLFLPWALSHAYTIPGTFISLVKKIAKRMFLLTWDVLAHCLKSVRNLFADHDAPGLQSSWYLHLSAY